MIIAVIVLAALILVIATHAETPAAGPADEPPTESTRAECADRVSRFVHELDELLAAKPRSVNPFQDLLEKYFPVKGCDIEEIVKICEKSKYIWPIDRTFDVVVIDFSSSTFWNPHSGFRVGFGLRKSSGDSELPYAMVNK